MSKYLENIVKALIDALNAAAQKGDQRAAGYAATIDFWLAEIEHSLAALDGFASRQANFASAVKKAVAVSREADIKRSQLAGRPYDPTKLYYGEVSTLDQAEHFLEKVTVLRSRLVEASKGFLGRLRNDGLIAPEQLGLIKHHLTNSESID